jgi:hypothetical protein
VDTLWAARAGPVPDSRSVGPGPGLGLSRGLTAGWLLRSGGAVPSPPGPSLDEHVNPLADWRDLTPSSAARSAVPGPPVLVCRTCPGGRGMVAVVARDPPGPGPGTELWIPCELSAPGPCRTQGLSVRDRGWA